MFGLFDINNFFNSKVRKSKQRTQRYFLNIYHLSSIPVFYPKQILF